MQGVSRRGESGGGWGSSEVNIVVDMEREEDATEYGVTAGVSACACVNCHLKTGVIIILFACTRARVAAPAIYIVIARLVLYSYVHTGNSERLAMRTRS